MRSTPLCLPPQVPPTAVSLHVLEAVLNTLYRTAGVAHGTVADVIGVFRAAHGGFVEALGDSDTAAQLGAFIACETAQMLTLKMPENGCVEVAITWDPPQPLAL